ncbi:hypothetical protein [uncultured Imperialibacter sp.]|uniref:hypothetical protein n=1 Tax=uncultured Imperialibacter sp. TaxID=1672639 RepID=UPI0030DA4031|tara:strand:+ start:45148 stop:45786 length:639 start_codon:yes stop_codon:yes gene_type:complete
MYRYFTLLFFTFLPCISFAQNGFGAFAGVHGGVFFPSADNVSSVYKNDVFPIGFHAGVGQNWFYLTAKYQKYKTDGTPEVINTANVSLSPTAAWQQSMQFYGARWYLSRNRINLFTEIGYCAFKSQETIDVNNPAYAEFNSQTELKSSGIGLVFGIEKDIFRYMSINAQVEWMNANYKENLPGLAGSSSKMGGVLLGLALNAKIETIADFSR